MYGIFRVFGAVFGLIGTVFGLGLGLIGVMLALAGLPMLLVSPGAGILMLLVGSLLVGKQGRRSP